MGDPQVLRRSLASPRQDLAPASRVTPMACLRESLLCLPLRIRALARRHRRGAPATTGLPSRCLPPPRSPTALKILRLGRTPHPWWSRFPILGRYVDRESARRTGTTARSWQASTRSGSKALPWRHSPPSGARVSERAGKAIPNGGQGSDVRGPRRPLRNVEHPAVLREGVAAGRYSLSVKAVWSIGQRSHSLLDLPLVGLM